MPERLCVCVQAGGSEKVGNSGEGGHPPDPDPQVVVHAELEGFVEITHTFHHLPSDKDGGLAYEARLGETGEIEWLGRISPEDAAHLVHVVPLSVDGARLRMGGSSDTARSTAPGRYVSSEFR